MHRRGLLLLFASIFVARSGYAESADAKERRARTACLAGDYAEGVRLLSELFVSTKDTTFIFNQGRCFEQNRRYEDAIARFQEFLRASKKVTKADKAEAQKHINDCKELLADGGEKSKAAQPAPVTPTPVTPVTPVAPTAVVPTPVVPTTAPSTPVVTSTANGSAGSGLRTAGIVTASVGGAALLAGVIFNLKVNSLASDIQKTDGYSPNKESDRKTYRTLGWVGYGVGAACVATGAVLYILGSRSGDRASVALVPAFSPDHAGAIVKGSF
jgi:hypothetical protein